MIVGVFPPKCTIEFKVKQKLTNQSGELETIKGTECLHIKSFWIPPQEISDDDYSVLTEDTAQVKIIEETHSIGKCLISFLNNYKDIENTIKKCKEIVINGECFEDIRNALRFLVAEFNKIDKCLNILNTSIWHNEWNLDMITQEKINKLDYSRIIAKKHKRQIGISKLNEKIDYMTSYKYLCDKCTEFLTNLEHEFTYMKNIIDTAFIPTKTDSLTNIFKGIDLMLPSPKISYSRDYNLHPIPYKYIYEINSLKDFFYCSIYHLVIERKVIKKCKGCNKYFIPNKTNQLYCRTKYEHNGEMIICKEVKNLRKSEEKAMEKEEEQQSCSYIFYDNLRTRLNRSKEKYKEEIIEFTNNYNYTEKKKEFENKFTDSNIVENELLKLYTKFDKMLQEKYKQTKPCKTKKYWVE